MARRTSVRTFGAGLALAGGVAVVVGSALPWVGIGGVNRSAFTLARVANEMHVFERRSQRLALYSLLTTPVLLSLGLLLLSVGWWRASALPLIVCGAIGLVAGGIGTWVSTGAGSGPILTVIGGLAALAGSILLAIFSHST